MASAGDRQGGRHKGATMRAVRTWTGARRIVLTKLQDPALVKCELIGTEQHAEQDNFTLSTQFALATQPNR